MFFFVTFFFWNTPGCCVPQIRGATHGPSSVLRCWRVCTAYVSVSDRAHMRQHYRRVRRQLSCMMSTPLHNVNSLAWCQLNCMMSTPLHYTVDLTPLHDVHSLALHSWLRHYHSDTITLSLTYIPLHSCLKRVDTIVLSLKCIKLHSCLERVERVDTITSSLKYIPGQSVVK